MTGLLQGGTQAGRSGSAPSEIIVVVVVVVVVVAAADAVVVELFIYI